MHVAAIKEGLDALSEAQPNSRPQSVFAPAHSREEKLQHVLGESIDRSKTRKVGSVWEFALEWCMRGVNELYPQEETGNPLLRT